MGDLSDGIRPQMAPPAAPGPPRVPRPPSTPEQIVAQVAIENWSTAGHIFKSKDVRKFLKNKHVVVIGDSVQRGVYKDLVCILQQDRLLSHLDELKKKAEDTCCNDRLVFRTQKDNSIDFKEVREYQSEDGFHLVQYYFVTRCYNGAIEAMIQEFEQEPPDVVLMNSCLWDISRYTPLEESEKMYRERMMKLCSRMRQVLPKTSMFVWCTTLPVASELIRAGFLLDEVSFMQETLRVGILEANYYVSQIVSAFGFDVLDLNFYMRPLVNKHRLKDGVHWDPLAHRHITDLILTFLHESWCKPMPAHTIEIIKRGQDGPNFSHLAVELRPSFAEEFVGDLGKMADRIKDHLDSTVDDEPPEDDEDEEEEEEEMDDEEDDEDVTDTSNNRAAAGSSNAPPSSYSSRMASLSAEQQSAIMSDVSNRMKTGCLPNFDLRNDQQPTERRIFEDIADQP